MDISWLPTATHVPCIHLSLNKLLGIKVSITLFFETPWVIWILYNLLFTQSTCVRSVKNAESNLTKSKQHLSFRTESWKMIHFHMECAQQYTMGQFHLTQHQNYHSLHHTSVTSYFLAKTNNKVYIKFVLKKSDFMRPEADKHVLNLWCTSMSTQ